LQRFEKVFIIMKVVLTHLGSPVPAYLRDCVEQFRRQNQDVSVKLIGSELPAEWHGEWYRIRGVSQLHVDNLVGSYRRWHKEVEFDSGLPEPNTVYPSPPNWLYNTMHRLFVLCDYVNGMKKEEFPIIHFENDVMVYADLSELPFDIMGDNVSVTMATKDHVSCAFMVIPSYNAMAKVCIYLLEQLAKGEEQLHKEYPQYGLSEMTLLSDCPYLSYLPTMPGDPWSNELGLFDPAAYGQYLGGTNLPGKGPGHAEEWHWIGNKILAGKLLPKPPSYAVPPSVKLVEQNQNHTLNTLHIHSKNLQDFTYGATNVVQ
jgi:hypothetical protein